MLFLIIGTVLVASLIPTLLKFIELKMRSGKNAPDLKSVLMSDAKITKKEDENARYRFTPARLRKMSNHKPYDAIFIGSGPGSMACAATLARTGKRCVVFEQGEQPGGGAHIFSMKGYEFETGVHYLGNDPSMERLLEFTTCGQIKLHKTGTLNEEGQLVHDEVIIGENKYEFMKGLENWAAMLHSKFPDNHKEIEAFVDVIRHWRSAEFQASTTWFFKLKVVSFLPAFIRSYLQRTLGSHFYASTQVMNDIHSADDNVKDQLFVYRN